jgi:hypothetical protein
LFKDIGPNGIISKNVCVVITVAMAMLLRNFGPSKIIFMTMYIYYFGFPVIFDGQFTSCVIKAVISGQTRNAKTNVGMGNAFNLLRTVSSDRL